MRQSLLSSRSRLAGTAFATLAVVGGACGLAQAGWFSSAAAATPAVTVPAPSPTTTAAPAPVETTPPPTVPPTTVTTAPPPPPPTTAAPPKPATVPGQEATVSIPSLGISLPVVEGGQQVIDEGIAAHYVGPGWLPPVAAGDPGTYWLAAHHSTHGDPFGRLPAIQTGASVVVTTTSGHVLTYTVTGTEVVGIIATYRSVYGTDPSAPKILLQTCLGATQRLLVHGILTSQS